MMSSTVSKPMEMRITSGPAPEATCCSSVSWRWVVEAGWMISERVSPTLARWLSSSQLSTRRVPSA